MLVKGAKAINLPEKPGWIIGFWSKRGAHYTCKFEKQMPLGGPGPAITNCIIAWLICICNRSLTRVQVFILCIIYIQHIHYTWSSKRVTYTIIHRINSCSLIIKCYICGIHLKTILHIYIHIYYTHISAGDVCIIWQQLIAAFESQCTASMAENHRWPH